MGLTLISDTPFSEPPDNIRAITHLPCLSAAPLDELRLLRQLMPCAGIFIGLIHVANHQVTILFSDGHGKNNGLQPGTKYSLEDYKEIGEDLKALFRGQTFLVRDIQSHPYLSLGLERILSEGFRSYLLIPLLVEKNFILFLNLSSTQPNGFTVEQAVNVREVIDSLKITSRTLETLKQKQQCLETINTCMTAVVEEERRRVARELHDRVGQDLTVISLNLSIILSQEGLSEGQNQRVRDSIGLVEQVIRGIRDVMVDLHPLVLDDFGLFAALKWHGQRLFERTGLLVSVEGQDLTPRLSPAKELVLFRVVEEALVNVTKHAKARTAVIRLKEEGPTIRLTVEDRGIGFDPEKYHRSENSGWGLINMQERLEGINGSFYCDSKPGVGTRIVAEVRR